MSKPILEDVGRYYSDRLREHGPVARGVDWNGPVSQVLRFRQLLRVFEHAGAGSINDLGCGYGALLEELDQTGVNVPYAGFDISQEMVAQAQARHATRLNTRFVRSSRPDGTADYGIASGIFNVRLDSTDDDWWQLVSNTLDAMHETSRLGFAFNCLTSYSDEPLMKQHLYYADPCKVFDHCKRRYSRQVALLHDYGIYEFTIIVRKAKG
jgi:SAM-dependent methyltransferase